MKRLCYTLILFLLALQVGWANVGNERQRLNFNSDWLLKVGDVSGAKDAKFNDKKWKHVTLPYAFNEDEAFRVDIHHHSDTVMWYRKHFSLGNTAGKKVFVEFEGVRQAGEFYLNGEYLGLHENGVMAVGFDLTPYLKDGDNVLAVRIDNDWNYREKASGTKYQWNNQNFNANYGGIPKNVWLHITSDNIYQTLPLYSNLQTTGVYIYASEIDVAGRKAVINAESEIWNESTTPRTIGYRVTVKDIDGKVVKIFGGERQKIDAGRKTTLKASAEIGGLHFWSWGYGYLYTVETELINENDTAFDKVQTRTGFRKTRFAEGKFWLNDRVLQLKGYAQRTSNEWPAVGMSVPAWLSDYSNNMIVEGNGNLIRWMHVTPWKQDVESCDRVGLLQAMPAGDAEKDCQGRQWEQRTELMRDAIIYNRNNPSVIFYECGNESISREHMLEMKHIRDIFDTHGDRAIGSREMLDINEAEYGGEMLYINKSKKHPMWQTEYCRDEGLRKYWDEYSYPFHKEGEGTPEYISTVTNSAKKIDPIPYNHNQDEFTVELVRRWYDYWRERPGTGTRVNSGGVKIIFSDSNTHYRGVENYRRSGVTDAMRIPKDGYFAHQVMWNGWVDTEKYQTYIVGHWNYESDVEKPVYVVSNGESVELLLNGKSLGICSNASKDGTYECQYDFLFIFKNVKFEAGELVAISRDASGKELSRYALKTAGEPTHLALSTIQNPDGFCADGADMALLQFEVVDKDGNRCPLDNREVKFTISGEGEWHGGIAQGPDNYILSKTLPVECGINRAIIRSTTKPGKIIITATAKGLPKETIVLTTQKAQNNASASTSMKFLSHDETPSSPSYKDSRRGVEILSVKAGANQGEAYLSFDDNELSEWKNDGKLETAWITYRLEREALIDDICLKLSGWRSRSYPLEVLAGDNLLWSGDTDKSLGYVHLNIKNPIMTNEITIRLRDNKNQKADAGGAGYNMTELAGGRAAELDNTQDAKGQHSLRIVEVEFLESVASDNIQPIQINLWEKVAPTGINLPKANFIESSDPKDTAFVYIYRAPKDINTGRAIVICPGGGYTHLSMENEGTKWAEFYQAQGITAILLKYRMPHSNRAIPISDAEAAIKLVRENAEIWNVKKDEIGIMGFSAGGHLASTIATKSHGNARPDFQVLLYPVISMKDSITHKGSQQNLLGKDATESLKEEYSSNLHVTDATPRAFICLANDDRAVIPENGVSYYMSLCQHKIPVSLHVYPKGGHGFGFRTTFPNHEDMLNELKTWLRSF